MAGELEHIRPTDPTYGNLASRTRNINFVDANGVLHSITHVYWSPTNDSNDRKLIWQRDHSPTQEDFTTIKYNNQTTVKPILVKFTANTNTINTVEVWTIDSHSLNNPCVILHDTSINCIIRKSLVINNISLDTDQLSVDGTITNVHHWTISNINVSINSGTTYYIYAGVQYASDWHMVPLVSKSYNTGDYKIVTTSDYTLEQTNDMHYESMTNTYLPKFKVNGVQI